MFASTDLAARIERAERSLIHDWTAAIAARRPEVDVRVVDVAGGVACWAGDGAPLNKVAAVGFDGVPDDAALDAVEALFAGHGAPTRFEVASLADPAVVAALTRRGYVLQGFEDVLGQALAPGRVVPAADEVSVALDGPDGFPTWLDTVVTGFATPDAQGAGEPEDFPREVLEEVITDMTAAEGFSRYLARRADAVAGAGTLRVEGGVAHLCGASTLPAHRRRGVQSVLLATRLRDAADAGATVAVMVTQPGSKSQENALRQGFAHLYTRAVLVKD
jgi:GNAT superfamily N-acetyltransferase